MMSSNSRLVAFLQVCICVLVIATKVHAQASTAQIVDVFYMGDNCSGQTYNTSYNAGACMPIPQEGSSYSYYCSADGLTVFQYLYSDSSCSTNSAYAIVEWPTTCGFQAKNFQIACVNPSLGPAAPLAFPPAGWLQTSECLNSSNSYKPASTCSGSGGDPAIHCYNIADSVGCHTFNYMGSSLYAQIGCNAEGTAAGTAMFTDSGCSTLVALDTVPVGCYGGTDIQCQGEPLPTLPTIGEIMYTSPDCTITPANGPPSTILYAPGACIGSRMYQCEQINGTLYGVMSFFTDPSHAGLCTGTPTNSTQLPGKCVNGVVFLCNSEDMQGAISQW